MSATLSVVINTKNCADQIETCLKAVQFADQIVVCDLQSHDQTKKIAQKLASVVIDGPDLPYVEPARNLALKKANRDWILLIDPDELINPALKKKIIEVINQPHSADVYYLARKNMVFGQWINQAGWWPDYLPRLFKRGTVTWRNEVHSQPLIEGRVEYLPAQEELAIWHQNYQTISQYLEKLDRYTTAELANMDPTAASCTQPATWFAALKSEFFSRFFARQGYFLGNHGFALAALQSFYQLIVQLKAWEAQGFPNQSVDLKSLNQLTKKLGQEWRYWWLTAQVNQAHGLKKIYWRWRRKLRW